MRFYLRFQDTIINTQEFNACKNYIKIKGLIFNINNRNFQKRKANKPVYIEEEEEKKSGYAVTNDHDYVTMDNRRHTGRQRQPAKRFGNSLKS